MLALNAEIPPLEMDANGVVRVSGSRVTLASVIFEYRNGATAEEIADRFPTLQIAEVYATIAFYLRHVDAVEKYLAEQRVLAAATEDAARRVFDQDGLRERLLARRGATSKG